MHLSQKNHLCGLRKSYLKISFDTVQQLMHVKNDLIHIVERNLAKFDAEEAYESILTEKRYGFLPFVFINSSYFNMFSISFFDQHS